jgi:hypothetical protein
VFVRALFSFFTNEFDANLPNFNASETTRKKKKGLVHPKISLGNSSLRKRGT